MKILEITSLHRNDFDAVLECEHCGKTQTLKYGYNDANYHNNVLPAVVCLSCGKRGNEKIASGVSDPGSSGGAKVKLVKTEVKKWVLE
jgi:C4-type Zn-finger protein